MLGTLQKSRLNLVIYVLTLNRYEHEEIICLLYCKYDYNPNLEDLFKRWSSSPGSNYFTLFENF